MEDQTLFSFLPKKNSGKPKIHIDSREAANRNGKKIVGVLDELGAETIICKLDFGDYLLGEDIVIERKTVFDLAGTLTQRFLFDQIFKMKEAYPRSMILIEGYMGLLRKFSRMSPESICGALFALTQANVPIIPTIDYKDTATFLVTSAKQLQKDGEFQAVIRHKIKSESIKDQQLFTVAGLPHIGPVLGESLLNHFKTVRNVFSASKEELMEIKGIGPNIAEGVMKILDSVYNDAKEADQYES